MRLIFMGTPDFAAATLKALIAAGHEIVCVYAQPPRPAGRGLALKPSPVQALAQAHGLAVRVPAALRSAEEQAAFAALRADAAIVAAYGLLLPKPILEGTRLGCFNVHASLLPRWRGAAPIQRAIMAGDRESGVTVMRMDEGLDTGAMCKAERVAITPETTAGLLHDALAALGARLMVQVLAEGRFACMPQPEQGITYARKIDKAEAHIDFTQSADVVRAHIHGLSPFPGAWFSVSGARLKVLACRVVEGQGTAGTFLDDALTIACGTGALRLSTLQREGKGAMDAQAFRRGFAIPAGTVAG